MSNYPRYRSLSEILNNEEEEQESSTLSDVGNLVWGSLKNIGANVLTSAEQALVDDWDIDDQLRESASETRQKVSPEWLEKIDKSGFHEGAELSLSGVAGDLIESGTSLLAYAPAAAMGPGGAALYGGAATAAMMGGGSYADTKEAILKLSKEELLESPVFGDYYREAAKLSPDNLGDAWSKAHESMAHDLARENYKQTGAIGALSGYALGPALADIFKGGKGIIGGAKHGAKIETVQETVESGAESYGLEEKLAKVQNRDMDIGKVARETAYGATLGGITGGGAGAIYGAVTPNEEQDKKPDTDIPAPTGDALDQTLKNTGAKDPNEQMNESFPQRMEEKRAKTSVENVVNSGMQAAAEAGGDALTQGVVASQGLSAAVEGLPEKQALPEWKGSEVESGPMAPNFNTELTPPELDSAPNDAELTEAPHSQFSESGMRKMPSAPRTTPKEGVAHTSETFTGQPPHLGNNSDPASVESQIKADLPQGDVETVAALPEQEDTEAQPDLIISSSGKPFSTMHIARTSAKAKGLKDYQVIAHGTGFAIKPTNGRNDNSQLDAESNDHQMTEAPENKEFARAEPTNSTPESNEKLNSIQVKTIEAVGNVGDTVTPNQDFDYLKSGEPVIIKSISKKGEVEFASDKGSTIIKGGMIRSLVKNKGLQFDKVQKQETVQNNNQQIIESTENNAQDESIESVSTETQPIGQTVEAETTNQETATEQVSPATQDLSTDQVQDNLVTESDQASAESDQVPEISDQASAEPGISTTKTDAEINPTTHEEAIDQGVALFSLSGDQGVRKNPPKSAKIIKIKELSPKNRLQAMKYARDHVQGKVFHNNDSGMDVLVSRKGLDKSLSNSAIKDPSMNELHFRAIASLPEILENAIVIENRGAKRDGDQHLGEIVRLYSAVTYGGSISRVKLTVKRTKRDGDKFYTYELQEISQVSGGAKISTPDTQESVRASGAEQESRTSTPLQADSLEKSIIPLDELMQGVKLDNGEVWKGELLWPAANTQTLDRRDRSDFADAPVSESGPGRPQRLSESRDDIIEQDEEKDNDTPQLLSDKKKGSISREEANKVIDGITKNWSNGSDNVKLVDTVEELPSPIVDHINLTGIDKSKVRGLYYEFDGNAYLVRENLSSRMDVERALFHEGYGHFGLRQLMQEDLRPELRKLFMAIGGTKGFNELAKKYGIKLSEYKKSTQFLTRDEKINSMMDELLAHMAETNRPGVKRALKEFWGKLRQWLRNLGFLKLSTVSESELFLVLKNARKAVEGKETIYYDESRDDIRFSKNDDSESSEEIVLGLPAGEPLYDSRDYSEREAATEYLKDKADKESRFLSDLKERGADTRYMESGPGKRLAYKAASAAAQRRIKGDALNEISSNESLGPFTGYQSTGAIKQGIDGNPELHISIYGNEQIAEGLDSAPALTFVVDTNNELVVYGPEKGSKDYAEFEKRGWAEMAHDRDGDVSMGGIDGQGWTKLKSVKHRQVVKLIGEVHARTLAWSGKPYVGLHWQRMTGATGGVDGRRSAIHFSLSANSAATLEDIYNKKTDSILDKAKDWLLSSKFVTAAKENSLALLTLRQLSEVAKKYLPQIKDYVDVVHKMMTDRNVMAEKAADFVDEWQAWASKNKKEADELANVMHDATLAGVDPSKPFISAIDNIDKRIRLLKDKARSRPGDGTAMWVKEIEALKKQKLQEPRRKKDWLKLKPRFDALSPEAQRLFQGVRDEYQTRSREFHKVLEQRIENAAMDGRIKKMLLAELRLEQESQEIDLYFPLARFGNYYIDAADPNGERVYLMFESEREQKRTAENMEKEGFKIEKQGRTLDKRFDQDANISFVNELMQSIDGISMNDKKSGEVRDAIYQTYLQHMPDRSIRKQYIHRKGVSGFSNDAIRAFADRMMKSSYQLARLKHQDDLTMLMDEMEKSAKTGNERAIIYNEMAKRHDWVMNPKNSVLSQKLTGVGFVWMLGVSPAAAAVNLTQTPVVAGPVLGSKFGMTKAFKELASASRQFSIKNGSIKDKLTGDGEKQAYQSFVDMGLLDATRAHDLAGLAEQGGYNYSSAGHKWMNRIAFLFHKAEQFNREVTAIAAYRLGMEKHGNHDQAVKEAAELTWDAHFDYCVDTETECLTKSGWKKYNELREGDVALAVDKDGRCVESNILEVATFSGNKEVIEFKANRTRFQMTVTPNHRCLVRRYDSRPQKWTDIKVERAASLKNHHHILRAPLLPLEGRKQIFGEDYAALLGWIASEGWYRPFRGGSEKNSVWLAQSNKHNPQYVKEIRGILDRLGGEYNEQYLKKRDQFYWLPNGELRKRIIKDMPEKILTQAMLEEMTPAEMKSLIFAFAKGDGAERGNGAWTIGQKNHCKNTQNLEIMQAMASICGIASTLSYEDDRRAILLLASEGKSGKGTHVKPLKQERKFVDTVWCPKTEHETWIARKNGAVFVTGNTNINRARFMQGDFMKVAMQFKQYSQNITYYLLRNLQQSLSGATKKEKQEARRQLLGTLTMTAVIGGINALPLWAVYALATAIFDDDDEPFDARTETHIYLAGLLGKDVADWVIYGAGGAGVSPRISLDGLWVRDSNRDLEGEDLWSFYAKQAVGPVLGGIAPSIFEGIRKIGQGEYQRGFENIVPKFVKDVSKAQRYFDEGATTLKGDQLKEEDEFSPVDLMLQAMGIADSGVSKQYQENAAIKGYEQRILKRRQRLLTRYYQAWKEGDSKEKMEVLRDISRFNKANPKIRVDHKTLSRSVKTRQRYRERADHGVILNKKLERDLARVDWVS